MGRNRTRHRTQKRRHQYKVLIEKYMTLNSQAALLRTEDGKYYNTFESLLKEIGYLNIKTQQIMLTDLLHHGAVGIYTGHYHKAILSALELNIAQHVLLK